MSLALFNERLPVGAGAAPQFELGRHRSGTTKAGC